MSALVRVIRHVLQIVHEPITTLLSPVGLKLLDFSMTTQHDTYLGRPFLLLCVVVHLRYYYDAL